MAKETVTVKLLLDGEPIGTKFMSKDQAKCARNLLQNMCHHLTGAHDLDGPKPPPPPPLKLKERW